MLIILGVTYDYSANTACINSVSFFAYASPFYLSLVDNSTNMDVSSITLGIPVFSLNLASSNVPPYWFNSPLRVWYLKPGGYTSISAWNPTSYGALKLTVTLDFFVFSSPPNASLVFAARALNIEFVFLAILSMVLLAPLYGFIPVKYHLANSLKSMTPSLLRSSSFTAASSYSSSSSKPSSLDRSPSSSLSIAPLPSLSNLPKAVFTSPFNLAEHYPLHQFAAFNKAALFSLRPFPEYLNTLCEAAIKLWAPSATSSLRTQENTGAVP